MEEFTGTYQEIKSGHPFSFKAVLRNFALTGLSLKDTIEGIDKYLKVPRVQFLYIHHSFRDELQDMDKLMKRLSKDHTFISYSGAVDLVLNGKIDKPYISISSDDGFKNNLYAAEILDNYGAKACFFINPGLIDEDSFDKIKQYCKEKLHMPPVEFLNWDDVLKLKADGHEIGGHTMFHGNIAGMDQNEMESDLQQTHDIIVSKCGEVKHFAFPYGRFHHFNEPGRQAVFKAGFVSCASAERGCHINNGNKLTPDKLCIRRDHVILDWNMGHTLYFLANNAKKRTEANNLFPY